MKRLLGTLALAGTTAVASPALAQEIQIRGPLAGARSVAHLVHYRESRIGLSPTIGMTIQDEFSREMFFGVRAEYYVTDWLGLGVWGAFAPVHINTSLTDQVESRATGGNANVFNRANFSDQIGRRSWMADLHGTFIPLRGKFALFQNLVADVDFFVFAGLAFIGVEERADYNNVYSNPGNDPNIRASLARSQTSRASRVAVTGTFGAGLNFYVNRFISVGIEYRAFPFAWNTSGTDENSTRNACGSNGAMSCEGFPDYVATYFTNNQRALIDSNDRLFHFNQMVNLAVTFFLPQAPRVGP